MELNYILHVMYDILISRRFFRIQIIYCYLKFIYCLENL